MYRNRFLSFSLSSSSSSSSLTPSSSPVERTSYSNVSTSFAKYLSGTLNYEVGVLSRIPVSKYVFNKEISDISKRNVKYAKDDWDSFETSWDFKKHPLV